MESLIVLLTAVVVLATAAVGFMAKLRRDTREIHVMVNSRLSDALERIDQLENTLTALGIELPDRPRRSK